ncbi:glutathione peroxidase [Flavobacterium piscinae]|uniref:Glutathione peroxidase n=1 Tax=Flavobacterium piscinae TaxID=2506424 RepID=A0A4Q1KGZ5_9FLAO|nr:glutathione peroxidase [Flavobacterium piscinae]MBC8882847.1 glutathione peroxidase [Flavobacterium piscinae]RXR28510.1 glutathione peroxidase [Flavobacterium piscinae]
MKASFLIIFSCFMLMSCQNHAQNKKENTSTSNTMKQSIYSFKVEDLEGKEFDFASLKGKKIMVVNTASKCGLTPQYKDLQALFEEYKDKGLVIIGFPANDFMKQEPGTNEEIGAFCQKNYGVTFPMMSKISVKGKEMHPLYQFLTQKAQNGLQDSDVEWNFQKYLLNEKGELEKVISPRTSPKDKEIIDWLAS